MRNNRTHGFTLIEMMIVTAVIGIALAIATPQYTSFVMRAKYAEALEHLNGVKSAVMKHAIEHEGFGDIASGDMDKDALEDTFNIAPSDGVGYLDTLTGKKNSNDYLFRLYQEINRSAIGAPDDAPDRIALYIRYKSRNGMLTTQCRYYSKTYGWAYTGGEKYVPVECRG